MPTSGEPYSSMPVQKPSTGVSKWQISYSLRSLNGTPCGSGCGTGLLYP